VQASGATCAGSAARGACVLLSDSLDDVRERNGEPPVSAVTIERGYPNLVLLPNCYRKISARYMYTVKNDLLVRPVCSDADGSRRAAAWRAGRRRRRPRVPGVRGSREPAGAAPQTPRRAVRRPHRTDVTSDIFNAVGVAFRPRSTRLSSVAVAAVCDDYLVSHNTTLSAGGRGGVRLLLVFPRSTIDHGKESAR